MIISNSEALILLEYYGIIHLMEDGFMDSKVSIVRKLNRGHLVLCILLCALVIASSACVGYMIGANQSAQTPTEPSSNAANPAYEYLVGAATWQMSAEAHLTQVSATTSRTLPRNR